MNRLVVGLAPCASHYQASSAAIASHGAQLKDLLMLRRLSATLLHCGHKLDQGNLYSRHCYGALLTEGIWATPFRRVN